MSIDLVITEGQKKCLALYRLFRDVGLTMEPVGLNGVWGFRGNIGKRDDANGKRVAVKGTIADFDRIVWTGRKVRIVFDTNVMTDPLVAAARNELAIELTSRGALVHFVDLQPENDVNGIDDFLAKHGKRAGMDLIENARPFDPSEKISNLPYTDVGNERAFEMLYGDDYRYNFTTRQWLRWNFTIWEPDALNQADRAMLSVAEKRLDAAAKAPKKGRTQALAAAFRLQNVRGRRSALESATSNPRFAKRAEDFDQNDYLFACANGVLDLQAGEFRPGRREDMLTRTSPVEWNPNAEYGYWLKFLREVFPEQPEMLNFLQRAAGYSLTGLTCEEVFFILYGLLGRNGKGTFLRILSAVLGDYAGNTDFSTLIAHRDGRAPRTDVAAMAGARTSSGRR